MNRVENSSLQVPDTPNNGNIAAQTFTFRELAAATKNFRPDCLIGEGGFGRVYKGTLEKSGQVRKKNKLFFFFLFLNRLAAIKKLIPCVTLLACKSLFDNIIYLLAHCLFKKV